MGAGRGPSGDLLQRQGRRGLDPDHQGRQQHRDQLLPRHTGTLVPPLPRVRGVQRDRVRRHPLRARGQARARQKGLEPEGRRLVGLSRLRLPDPRGDHATAAGQVDRGKPRRLQEGRPLVLAQRLQLTVDAMGEDRPQVPRRQERPAAAQGGLQHPARPAMGGSRRPRGRGHHARPPRGLRHTPGRHPRGAARRRAGAHLRRGHAGQPPRV